MGTRLFAIGYYGHLGALYLVAANGLINHTAAGHYTGHHGLILSLHGSGLELRY
jgi:hypothetical protein